MRRRFLALVLERQERLGYRLRCGSGRRYVRCPVCRSVQSIPTGRGQSKVICRRCGEIFLRRT